MSIFPDLRTIQDTTTSIASANTAFAVNLAQAMVVAAEASLRTASQSTTAAPAGDVLNTLSTLNTMGYTASISGSTLTVTW